MWIIAACTGIALAARKPLLISHTSALASYFGAAAVLTENTAEQIAANVQRAYAQRGELAQKANQWVAGNEEYMGERIATLKQVLRSLNVRLEAAQKKPVAS